MSLPLHPAVQTLHPLSCLSAQAGKKMPERHPQERSQEPRIYSFDKVGRCTFGFPPPTLQKNTSVTHEGLHCAIKAFGHASLQVIHAEESRTWRFQHMRGRTPENAPCTRVRVPVRNCVCPVFVWAVVCASVRTCACVCAHTHTS